MIILGTLVILSTNARNTFFWKVSKPFYCFLSECVGLWEHCDEKSLKGIEMLLKNFGSIVVCKS